MNVILMIATSSLLFNINNLVECKTCPEECLCEKPHGRLKVICKIDDEHKLKKILKDMSEDELEVHKLYLEGDDILALGPNILGNMQVVKFYFNGASLQDISPQVFEDQEDNLYKVGFDNTQLTALPIAPIINLHRLEQYELRHSRGIKVIPECAFCPMKYPETVQRIDLRGNNIEVIQSDAFKPLLGLKWLRLWDNNIRYIDHNIFPPRSAGHLTYVDLEDNELKNVPHHVIEPLPYEAYISMNHNMIEHLADKTIDAIIERNITVKLYHNQVNCNCGFKKIAARNENGIKWHGHDDICTKPHKLVRRRIHDLKKSDFENCK